ncbi:hypothetical protein [Sphingobacterium bovistauri]|uniref:Cro/C1-type HTH DNA-binding domain-containing protein n=1 Tax=Sphingobacterium bovistauri TaxID=2781959 RepID=A0ABS7Z1K3_9SPHI|nr:hypothetical protein [Sphingobacterium bovistauri]MCA5004054.1 hypothetical protein [Sphingobacterium bovistauri]
MKPDRNNYSTQISKRLQLIMSIIDLNIVGLAEFLNHSTSHIYGILNQTRPLSDILASELGKKLNFDGSKIFNLNSRIPRSINKSEELIKFKKENAHNKEYFISLNSNRSSNTFVLEVLIKSDYLNNGYKYLNEIRDFCEIEMKRVFVRDQLSKALQYAVKIGRLKSVKKNIKLKNGNYGSRKVDVYFK